MGKSDKRELKNRLEVLIMHLLKWQYQAEQRSTSWKSTIKEQRRKLNRLLKDVPSLKNNSQDAVSEIYEDAVEWASEETGLSEDIFSAQCPYTQDQLLDENFYPDDSN
jgi:DNA anti-recombination protein RmuC